MKVVICDSDIKRAMKVKALVEKYAEKNDAYITAETSGSGKRLLFFMETKFAGTDLICLAYHMPGMDGMETARKLREQGYMGDIVFYSADESRERDGYEVDAMAYIIVGKDSDEMMESVLMKAYKRCQRRNEEIMSFSYRDERCVIPLDDIIYFEVIKHTVTVHYYKDGNDETFDFYSTLSKVEADVDGKGFLRIHKSYLVAHRHIRKKEHRQVIMTNGDVLPIGRNVN